MQNEGPRQLPLFTGKWVNRLEDRRLDQGQVFRDPAQCPSSRAPPARGETDIAKGSDFRLLLLEAGFCFFF